ncbi:hypothetical protein NDU88_003508 [Pleurodeles waltl]|uniref:Uncharacterized protein n=1 Tax=Pleurodeles waltl TaxID=8319 RepID=A0AAV7KXN3_PLEWA|nr:hypothetical protein NDU88_003508 [Pleurodeles waltl]
MVEVKMVCTVKAMTRSYECGGLWCKPSYVTYQRLIRAHAALTQTLVEHSCHKRKRKHVELKVTLVPYSKQKRVGAQRHLSAIQQTKARGSATHLGATRQAEARGSEISPECRTQQAKVCRSAASSC